jgi:hypothetical protein
MPRREDSAGCFQAFLLGCGFLVLLLIGAVAAAVYLFNTRGPELAAKFIDSQTGQILDVTGMTSDEKSEVKKEISRLTGKLAAHELTAEHGQRLSQALEETPILSLLMLQGLRKAGLNASRLAAGEIESADLEMGRLQRGLVESKIPNSAAQNLLEAHDFAEKQMQTKVWTAEDWKEFITGCKRLADEKQIPTEPYLLDVRSQMRKIVDDILGEGDSAKPVSASSQIQPASGAIQPATGP